MKQRLLGKTGISVSEIGIGGLFTSSLGPGFEQSRAAVQRAVELGINYIDTAPAYANSEEVLGRFLRDIRTPLVLSTKLGGRPQPFDPQNAGQLRQSVKESLRLLGREVVDVLMIHEPDRPQQYPWWADVEAVSGPVIDVLDGLKREGVIRFTGLGGTTVTEMAHLIRSDKFDIVLTAFNYSALFREAANEVLPAARERNMGIVLGSVLQQGALARRYEDVVRNKPLWMAESRRQQFEAFYQFLDELRMPIVELGMRFALSNPDASTILIGAKSAEQIEEAVAAADKGPLPGDVLRRLDQIAALVPYRPFEEPMILPINRPREYHGPGLANLGTGAQIGKPTGAP
jgi:aryl-alcohol dehydrogenase-like predicted oxidoreductase